MKFHYAFLVAALTVIGCSDDATNSTNTDTGFSGEGGPITERPDDGPDTARTDTGVGGDTSTADTSTTETSTDSATDAPGDAGGVTTVTVGPGNSFMPATVSIKVGSKVRWVFAGGSHNVVSGASCTADNKFCNPSGMSCASAPKVSSGTYEHTFTTAGTFPYFCEPHCGGGMTGSVVVTP